MPLVALNALLQVVLLAAGPRDLALPRLRPEGAELRALVADATERSATFRQLVDRIQQSDLIVYVRAQHFPSARLEGRIGFVIGATEAARSRILIVEIACPRTAAAQAEALAHELHHAVEIADATWVRDPASLEAFYRRIGHEATPLDSGVAFETSAARATGARVRQEIAAAPKLTHEEP